ncbi:hypothetical protein HMPREF9554_01105 [Treponema phagedenis F0421]|nr:hypothetical protein HMPREF9554_01105 [Treponema phagedenis F0421]
MRTAPSGVSWLRLSAPVQSRRNCGGFVYNFASVETLAKFPYTPSRIVKQISV